MMLVPRMIRAMRDSSMIMLCANVEFYRRLKFIFIFFKVFLGAAISCRIREERNQGHRYKHASQAIEEKPSCKDYVFTGDLISQRLSVQKRSIRRWNVTALKGTAGNCRRVAENDWDSVEIDSWQKVIAKACHFLKEFQKSVLEWRT